MENFKAGDKVVCIDDTIRPEVMPTVLKYYSDWVEKDAIYTIRDVVDNDNIVSGVLLHQIRNKPIYIELVDKVQEPAFGSFRFKLLESMEEEFEEVEYYINML